MKKALGLVGVLVFLVLAYLLLRGHLGSESGESEVARRAPAETSERTSPPPNGQPEVDERPSRTVTEQPVPETGTRPPVVLPPLEESDPFVRERLEPFPLPEEWVERDDLVRRLAALVDNATRGELPRRSLRFLKPEGRFEVVEREGRLYADPDNPRRFDAHLDLLERIEPSAAARLLGTIEPLLDAAFRELGRPVSPRDAIREAIDRVVEMDVAPGPHELVQRKVLYEYADPEIESLPPLEKQMLRLGTRNLGRLQAYLIELRTELDLSAY